VADQADPARVAAAVNSRQGQLADRMGIVVTEASARRMVATMPVAGNTQPYGLLHGGASAVLIETLGSVGAALHGAPLGKIAVGVDLNATHHRGVSSGSVTATAVPLHLGSTMVTYQVSITDAQERLVCTGRVTCLLREAPPRPT
jgi:uncharacterized protein (TIGR00369 family)